MPIRLRDSYIRTGRDEGAMRTRTAAAALLVVTLWTAPTVAEASFNQQAASAQSASSALLHPPTNFSVSRANCSLTLTWTPTVDAKASGYKLYNGATLVQTITGKATSSTSFKIANNTAFSFTMLTTYLLWTSSSTQALPVSC